MKVSQIHLTRKGMKLRGLIVNLLNGTGKDMATCCNIAVANNLLCLERNCFTVRISRCQRAIIKYRGIFWAFDTFFFGRKKKNKFPSVYCWYNSCCFTIFIAYKLFFTFILEEKKRGEKKEKNREKVRFCCNLLPSLCSFFLDLDFDLNLFLWL